jgi:hypothetical protein
MLWIACGGDVVQSGSAGAAGAAGASADAGKDVYVPPTQDASTTVGTVTLRLVNDASVALYINWGWDDQPMPGISSSVHPADYALTSECTAACSPQCDCLMCDMAPPRVKKLLPGGYVDYVWDGHWFDIHECGSSGCNCYDARIVSPGAFSVRVTAALGISSGTPSAADPTVYDNGWLDSTAGECLAAQQFEMTASDSKVTIGIACAMP